MAYEKIAAAAIKEAPQAVKFAEEALREVLPALESGGIKALSHSIDGFADSAVRVSSETALARPYVHAQLQGGQEILKRLDTLGDQYKLVIPAAGQEVSNPFLSPTTRTLMTRLPSMHEVTGIEEALKRSAPSHLRGRDGLTMNFYERSPAGDVTASGAWAAYSSSNVYFVPGRVEKLAAISEVPADSIKGITMHEVAHNGQVDIGLQHLLSDYTIADKIGWQPKAAITLHPNMKDEEWLFRSRNGNMYSHSEQGTPAKSVWTGFDRAQKLQPELTNAQLRQEAVVPPISNYFPNPTEMITEGTTYYRFSPQTRLELMRKSPNLYQVVQDLDRLEIQHAHGLNASGAPLFIRNPEGLLVENTFANRLIVKSFEAGRHSL